MCFSLATLGGVAVRIADPDCVRKTFPGYFAALSGVMKLMNPRPRRTPRPARRARPVPR